MRTFLFLLFCVTPLAAQTPTSSATIPSFTVAEPVVLGQYAGDAVGLENVVTIVSTNHQFDSTIFGLSQVSVCYRVRYPQSSSSTINAAIQAGLFQLNPGPGQVAGSSYSSTLVSLNTQSGFSDVYVQRFVLFATPLLPTPVGFVDQFFEFRVPVLAGETCTVTLQNNIPNGPQNVNTMTLVTSSGQPFVFSSNLSGSGTLSWNDFSRGDINANGSLSVDDPITLLNYLFQGGSDFGCLRRLDVNDNGSVDIDDPIRLLDYLFQGGPPLNSPLNDCDNDNEHDFLGCDVEQTVCP